MKSCKCEEKKKVTKCNDAKTTYYVLFSHKLMPKITKKHIIHFCMFLCGFAFFFLYFLLLVTEKVALASKNWFWPANSLQVTRLLVEIHNTSGPVHTTILLHLSLEVLQFKPVQKTFIKICVFLVSLKLNGVL